MSLCQAHKPLDRIAVDALAQKRRAHHNGAPFYRKVLRLYISFTPSTNAFSLRERLG